MIQTVETIDRWSELWAWLALAVTWQSALLVGLSALVAVFLHRSSPRLRYWLWQIVAIKVLLMPFWTVAVPMPFVSADREVQASTSESRAEFAALPAAGLRKTASAHPMDVPRPITPLAPPPLLAAIRQVSWQSWLMFGWLLVVASQLAVLAWQCVRLRRLLLDAAPAPEALRALVGELAGQLGLRRAPMAVVTRADCSFFVCGIVRPVLVLPKSLLVTLDDGRLRQVLLHELAHIKRLDLLYGWPAEIACRLYFFHPLIHWLTYRIRLERELACDQVAMAASGRSPIDYAQTLVLVVTQASQPSALKVAAISAELGGHGGVPEPEYERPTGRGGVS
jgi:beta-lactamase regulating signal transducer with metallopeptidase domain